MSTEPKKIKKTKPLPPPYSNIKIHKLKKAGVLEKNDHEAIKKQLEKSGICVFGPLRDDAWVDSGIKEIKHHLESQPRAAGFEIRLKKTSGLTKSETDHLKKCWVPHVTFGAPCEAPAYHLKKAWELRQDPALCGFFSFLLGETDLRVSVDRYKAKLPGTGEREFCHWDSNPWKWNFDKPSFQGIMALTPIEFVCVPETHNKEFSEKFKEEYQSKVKAGNITLLNPEDDPMELNKKEQVFQVPKGYFVIWDDKLLHSSYPNKSKDIKFALYLTYHRKSDCKQSDEMRVESYLSGKAPPLQPSGFRFSHMPPAWVRFPKLAGQYHARLPENKREYRVSSDGKKYPIITETVPDYYSPPKLTELGNRLLYGNPNPPTKKRKRESVESSSSKKRKSEVEEV